MHGRIRLGLRIDQELAVLDPVADVGGEIRQQGQLRERRLLDVRQDPESAAGNRPDRAALLRVQQLVLAVAEQHEVQLQEPVEELGDLLDHLGGVAHVGRARQLDHVPDPVLHRIEVPDHERDVSEDPTDALLELGRHLVAERTIDLEMHQGLAVFGFPARPHADEMPLLVAIRADHRVEQPFDRETPRRQLLRDRVDEEGRIVGHDLDDGPVAAIAVGVRVRVEDAHGGSLEASALREREGGGRERVQLVGRDPFEVVFGQAPQEGPGERLDRLAPPRLGLTPDPREHLLDLGMEFGGTGCGR